MIAQGVKSKMSRNIGDCFYCHDEGLDIEPATMCEGHFSNTMAIAQGEIDYLKEELEKAKEQITHLRKGVDVYSAYVETRYTFFAEKETRALTSWLKEDESRSRPKRTKKNKSGQA